MTMAKSAIRIKLFLPSALLLMGVCGWAVAEPSKATRIHVDKSERILRLIHEGEAFRTYPVALGDSPRGHKLYEGDERTPEGLYLIDGRNPDSHYHLSLSISYPNSRDVARARSKGLEPGGQIMIHGTPDRDARRPSDWTDGCIAVSNAAMEEIWQLVDEGTLIEITP
jgi:murein L,D-transpeptidase YafK